MRASFLGTRMWPSHDPRKVHVIGEPTHECDRVHVFVVGMLVFYTYFMPYTLQLAFVFLYLTVKCNWRIVLRCGVLLAHKICHSMMTHQRREEEEDKAMLKVGI